MQRVSLKFLAKELGVTEGTVSRALNDYPDISKATRKRVLEVAEKFNYKANQTARRLATGVAEAVAYLMPPNTNTIAEPFVSQLLEGIGASLAKRGWDLLVVQASACAQARLLISCGKEEQLKAMDSLKAVNTTVYPKAT